MVLNKAVRRIAVVGTGVIGASWSAQYLARGFDVVATDPAPNAEVSLRKYVDDAVRENGSHAHLRGDPVSHQLRRHKVPSS
jgi:3-hydroxyacyl-CoA dehydrogenase